MAERFRRDVRALVQRTGDSDLVNGFHETLEPTTRKVKDNESYSQLGGAWEGAAGSREAGAAGRARPPYTGDAASLHGGSALPTRRV